MKGLLAFYLIFLLIFPGCMMAPMALLPLFTDKPKSPAPAPAQTGATGPQAGKSGRMMDRQQQGETRTSQPMEQQEAAVSTK